MDGIIIVNKPKGYTSRDIVNIVSKSVGTKKVGHTGTLDPIATGVLVVCVGNATKLVDMLTSTYKEYIAEVTLGIQTDTLDIEGNILKKEDVFVTKEEVENVLNTFIGKYIQEVPIYSAVRVNGKKLYEYAREGVSVELPKREVEIKSISLESFNKNVFTFKTEVSKGTYIRSLIRDITLKLNTIGIMSNLERCKQGVFDIKDSYTIEDIKNGNYKMISIEEALKDIYAVDMDDILYKKISNGAKIKDTYNKDMILFKYNGKAVALYQKDNDILKIYKML